MAPLSWVGTQRYKNKALWWIVSLKLPISLKPKHISRGEEAVTLKFSGFLPRFK